MTNTKPKTEHSDEKKRVATKKATAKKAAVNNTNITEVKPRNYKKFSTHSIKEQIELLKTAYPNLSIETTTSSKSYFGGFIDHKRTIYLSTKNPVEKYVLELLEVLSAEKSLYVLTALVCDIEKPNYVSYVYMERLKLVDSSVGKYIIIAPSPETLKKGGHQKDCFLYKVPKLIPEYNRDKVMCIMSENKDKLIKHYRSTIKDTERKMFAINGIDLTLKNEFIEE